MLKKHALLKTETSQYVIVISPAGSRSAMPNSRSYPQTAICQPLYWAEDRTLGENWSRATDSEGIRKDIPVGIISAC